MIQPFNIPICHANIANKTEQFDVVESVQKIVANLSVENLKLLAEKSSKPGINQKIQTYKKFM